MDRLALLLAFLVGVALGKATSPETVRRWRYWMERQARGDASRDAAELAKSRRRAIRQAGR